jgi:hypothetical protein
MPEPGKERPHNPEAATQSGDSVNQSNPRPSGTWPWRRPSDQVAKANAQVSQSAARAAEADQAGWTLRPS